MGEAKRRQKQAERVQRGVQASVAEVRLLIPCDLNEQIAMRHALVTEDIPSRDDFLRSLLLAGIETFDHDVQAVLAHERGESRHVAPPEPAPEPLVVAAADADPKMVKTLAKLHDTTLLIGGRL